MFEGFDVHDIEVGGVTLHGRIGGSGPPLLLLHGHPQTHVMWHRVAPLLAEQFTVLAFDLRGYGDSSVPVTRPDHSPFSKRTMAADFVRLMAQLGYSRFSVVGHDRGGRVAYRMALDHPELVERVAVLDIVPTAEMWRFASENGREFGLVDWHWLFLAQPFDHPERIINAAPEIFYFATGTGVHDPEALVEYRRPLSDPTHVHALCEDYRAGAGIDAEVDEADAAAGRRITAPLLALWSSREELPVWFDVLEVWRRWADDVRGHGIDAGHYLAEAAPDEVAVALREFLAPLR